MVCIHLKHRCSALMGYKRDYLFSLAPVLDQNQTLSGWVVVLSDLTDKKPYGSGALAEGKTRGGIGDSRCGLS